jgi:hypothetical protein
MPESKNCELPVVGGDLICGIIQQGDLEQAIRCVVEAFTQHEPMTTTLGISLDEFRPFAKIICEKAIRDQLSLVAKEKGTNNVAGFSLAEDFISEPPEELEKLSNKFHPIFALLNDLDEAYKKASRLAEGEILRLFMGGACFAFRNMKIVTTLIEAQLRLAREKNFLGVVAEVTGPISQHILIDKFSFRKIKQIEYKSYVYRGKKVFSDIEEASACIFIEKRF